MNDVKQNVIEDVAQLCRIGKKLSKSDIFVIIAAHSIKLYINNDLPESETLDLINSINKEIENRETQC